MYTGSRLTILMAEDNLIPAFEIADIVRELGCRVIGPVAKLAELIHLIETTDFDAALLDVELKGGEKVYPAADLCANAASLSRSSRPTTETCSGRNMRAKG